MKADRRTKRESEIMAAAYKLLDEGGAAGMSMLAVAKAAKASNETLYNWYGDKLGLLCAMVARDAEDLRQQLEAVLAKGDAPLEVLDTLGPLLLEVLTSPRAIALNRAAAADATGVLGAALAQVERGSIAPMIGALCQQALDDGAMKEGDAQSIAETYMSLLIGDWQIRLVVQSMPAPRKAALRARADRALMLTWRLHGTAKP
ncbi:TetR/AcrR family transcriptional regulator [Vannielia sp.]|uniref:TetR/AcrR family transcriptional regulator n=1 Tax=Vannielia sp. TaxID=2813045 RepID=UPI00261DA43F|nr:TetR/AcrR family transcriptional regulator [Vannielia sp.]MDF1871111.1 TetR/AcrR family transcriptional regulator [Vannielia sp.]